MYVCVCVGVHTTKCSISNVQDSLSLSRRPIISLSHSASTQDRAEDHTIDTSLAFGKWNALFNHSLNLFGIIDFVISR
jgi:hypothetical protein